MKTMIVRQVGAGENDVLLFLHTARTPERNEWSEMMAGIARYTRLGDFRRLRILVVTDGGGPDTAMRGELQAFYKSRNHSPKTAVVTTSVVSRGIVAAVNWFNPHIKAFSPRSFPDALAHLDLPRTTLPRLLREFSEMERELTPNSCLSLVNGASASATL
jgi:hypothetical protein